MLSMEVCVVHICFASTSRVSDQHKQMMFHHHLRLLQSMCNHIASGQSPNSSPCPHADDDYTTQTSASSANQTARSGTKAGQIQEPLTDLEQLEPDEEEYLDASTAGQ